MNETKSVLTLTPQIISKVIAKFNNDLKIAIEEENLYLIYHTNSKFSPDLKIDVKIENIINNTILIKLIPQGFLQKRLIDMVIPVLNKKIEELISVYPGLIKFNYPDLLIDLNTITLKNGMKLTELVELLDIIIDENIKVVFK